MGTKRSSLKNRLVNQQPLRQTTGTATGSQFVIRVPRVNTLLLALDGIDSLLSICCLFTSCQLSLLELFQNKHWVMSVSVYKAFLPSTPGIKRNHRLASYCMYLSLTLTKVSLCDDFHSSYLLKAVALNAFH